LRTLVSTEYLGSASCDVQQFRVQYTGRSNISRAKLMAEGNRYRENWNLLLGSRVAEVTA
jgi:hypothetical protein